MSTLFKDTVVFETYGETIAVGEMLYKSTGTGNDSGRTTGRLYKLDTSNADRNSFYGIAKDSGNNGDTNRRVVTGGRFDGLSALTPGLPVYANPAVPGGVTQVRPSSNVQVVGMAIDADSISVNSALAGSFGIGEGSGGVGGVDILFVQDFETAALGDFTQTGLVLSTTNPLKGSVSARLVHQAAINQSFKQTIAVDEKFRNRNITLKLNIKSSAPAGDVTITVRDETNAVNLVTSEQLPASNEVGGAIGIVSFNIPATCASLSYEIIALPEAGSPVTIIDDIIAELSIVSLLSTSVTVPVVTGWQGYTPTFQGFGTPTNIEFEWRRVGENVEIRGKFTGGTSTAVEARVGLPSGFTSAGTDIIASLQIAGTGISSRTDFNIPLPLIEPSVNYFTFGRYESTNVPLSKANANSILLSGDRYSFTASVPCAGLTANDTKTIGLAQSVLVQDADSMVRVSVVNGYGSTATRIRRFTNTLSNLGSDIVYSDSPTLGASFVIQSSGVYSISYIDSFSGASQLGITLNQSVLTTNVSDLPATEVLTTHTTGGANFEGACSWQGYLVAGSVIRAGANAAATGDASITSFTITKQGALKQINTNPNQKITIPTSELRMEGASTRGSTATAIVRFDNIAKIRGDAFTVESDAVLGTRITMRKKGKLDVAASIMLNASGSSFAITRNQTNLTIIDGIVIWQTNDNGYANGISSTIDVNVGDVIRVSANTGVTNSSNSLNLFFQEQDISVSVTNTLPQFSESDSSVRLSIANGFGSTANSTMRFSTLIENLGTDIEYVDSASNGATFTAKSDGLYAISATVQGSGGVTSFGITRNAIGNEVISTLGAAGSPLLLDWTSESDSAFNNVEQIGGQYRLSKGDVVRLQANGAPITNGNIRFAISKVGKPNVTGVDVTPFVNIPRDEIEVISASGANRVGGGLISNYTNFTTTNRGILAQSPSRITVLKKCRLEIISTWAGNSNNQSMNVYVNNVLVQSVAGNLNALTSLSTTDLQLNVGDYVEFQVGNIGGNTLTSAAYTITATAASDNIISPTESFSTDTALLQYAPSSLYTLTTLANAPVGTYITFTYAASTNTRTQTTTRPTQTDADMNVNGVRIFARAFNAASTAAEPAAFAIQIGKGLKGKSLDLYKNTGKSVAGTVDAIQFTSASFAGLGSKDYNELTGILFLDAGNHFVTTTIAANFVFTDATAVGSGYLVINASKSPVLTSVPVLQPRIATLSDVKAGSANGGTATSGSFQTRVLNTVDDPTGIVTSLASNQFVLPAGEYYIEGSSSFYYTQRARVRVRNVTDSSDAVLSLPVYNDNSLGQGTMSACTFAGKVIISSPKTFELQYRVGADRVNDGLGFSSGFGVNEVYSVVKITKVK